MATKLDTALAKLAIVIAQRDPSAASAEARKIGQTLKPKDIAKLPGRWYPNITAKGAGAPDLADPWHRLWFEAVVEVLFQTKRDGLPQLLGLWERDDSTYHEFVLIRMLRLAVEAIETETILARVRARLATLHYIKTRESVQEVVNGSFVDPRPLKLLEPMADIVLPCSDGDTLGKYIREFTGR